MLWEIGKMPFAMCQFQCNACHHTDAWLHSHTCVTAQCALHPYSSPAASRRRLFSLHLSMWFWSLSPFPRLRNVYDYNKSPSWSRILNSTDMQPCFYLQTLVHFCCIKEQNYRFGDSDINILIKASISL